MAGAIVGLRVPGVTVDDVGTTAKTLPEFPQLWADMLAGQDPQPREAGRLRRVRRPGPRRAGLAAAHQEPDPSTPTPQRRWW